MGHRANFILIQGGGAEAYWDQWAAMGCLDAFAAGPDVAIKLLKDLESTDELLDWAFAEGGYLIDLDDKAAIVFGISSDEFDLGDVGEDRVAEEFCEFDPRRYLEEVAPAWKGWKLVFDDRGVDAFAIYLQSKKIDTIQCPPASHPPDTQPPCELQA